jgi:hypothetical protein
MMDSVLSTSQAQQVRRHESRWSEKGWAGASASQVRFGAQGPTQARPTPAWRLAEASEEDLELYQLDDFRMWYV